MAGGGLGTCGSGIGHMVGCGVMWQGVGVFHKG